MKGVPFLSKMVYKRVRVCTSGQGLPVKNFVEYPPGVQSEIKVFMVRITSTESLTKEPKGHLSELVKWEWYLEKHKNKTEKFNSFLVGLFYFSLYRLESARRYNYMNLLNDCPGALRVWLVCTHTPLLAILWRLSRPLTKSFLLRSFITPFLSNLILD